MHELYLKVEDNPQASLSLPVACLDGPEGDIISISDGSALGHLSPFQYLRGAVVVLDEFQYGHSISDANAGCDRCDQRWIHVLIIQLPVRDFCESFLEQYRSSFKLQASSTNITINL